MVDRSRVFESRHLTPTPTVTISWDASTPTVADTTKSTMPEATGIPVRTAGHAGARISTSPFQFATGR